MSKIIELVVADIESRAAVGLAKYGVTLDRQDLSRKEWLQHAYEEALDLACYLRVLIEKEHPDYVEADCVVRMREAGLL